MEFFKKLRNLTFGADSSKDSSAYVYREELMSDLHMATNMAHWALNPGPFNHMCNCASILGNFLIHYWNREEAKTALAIYARGIASNQAAARFTRRDILFDLKRHFMEPDFDSFLDEIYDSSGEDEELYQQLKQYDQADDATRSQMRTEINSEVLLLLDAYYERVRFYRENQEYLNELYELEESIECNEYGI